MKKILFTDLDGTLLNNNSQIGEEMRTALKEMTSRGHCLVLSSGRPLDSILEVKELAGIDSANVYIIATNGSIIYDCNKKEILKEIRVSFDEVEKVWNLAAEHGIHIHTYTANEIISAKEDEEIIYYRRRIHLPLLLSNNPLEILKLPPHKLLMIDLHDHDRLCQMQTLLESQFADRLQTVFSNPYYLEVFSKESGKGNALRWLCDYLGIPVSNSFAAGDAQNDLSMLNAAGTSIVMCNGAEDVKQQADIITTRTNDECGLADIIYEKIL